MPITPKASRRSPATRREDTVSDDRSPSLIPRGRNEATSVQDRIRQWQAQSTAAAADPDLLSLRSVPLSIRSQSASRASTNPRYVRSPSPEEESAQERNHSNSTPRKRIISDGRWKTDPTSKRTAPRSEHDTAFNSRRSKQEREQRRRRRKQQETHSNAFFDDGIRVYTDQEPPASDGDMNSGIDEELARQLSDMKTDIDFERDSYSLGQPKKDQIDHQVSSKYVETLGRSYTLPSQSEEQTLKPKKNRLFGKTKELFSKSEQPTVVNRLPSIEAWLDDQPDPFIDDSIAEDLNPVEVPAPLRKRSRKKRNSSIEADSRDPNEIWKSVTSPNILEPTPLAKNMPEAEADLPGPEAGSPQHAESPTNLRRRGAHTRRNRRSMKDISLAEEVTSQRSGPESPETVTAARDMKGRASTGDARPSPIASVQNVKESNEPPSYQGIQSNKVGGLKRRLTTHEDLMSVLSLPRTNRGVRSAKTVKGRHTTNTNSESAQKVLSDLVIEEQKYSRELRTLVDGVIPVLLHCVLSKSDSAAAAGLFASSANASQDLNFTRPIVEMGIALERLKSLHNRIPFENIDSLLIWAQTAQKAYRDYLKAWRLGFNDVIVNLSPLQDGKSEMGMARDDKGDVVDAEGKKVDVAYLLKRPLVRIKNLGKTFHIIQEHCKNPLAQEVAQIYIELTTLARRRHQEEQARLEDEAAVNIDTTRVRDIKTLAAISGVSIKKDRKVKARDQFGLTLYHSTGQRIDCQLEIIFRENAPDEPEGGDLLICEIDASGKWLLFAPVEMNLVSARHGENGVDLVVMIRGRIGLGQEWHELLALQSNEPGAANEWMSMLGSTPLPPKLSRIPSFLSHQAQSMERSTVEDEHQVDSVSMDIPMGEPSTLGQEERQQKESKIPLFEKPATRLNLGGGLQAKPLPALYPTSVVNKSVVSSNSAPSVVSSDTSILSERSQKELPKVSPNPPLPPPKEQSEIHKRDKQLPELKETSPRVKSTQFSTPKVEKRPETYPNDRPDPSKVLGLNSDHTVKLNSEAVKPSAPSKDLPIVSKIRTGSSFRPASSSTPLANSILDQWKALSGFGKLSRSPAKSQIYTKDVPSPPSVTLRQEQHSATIVNPIHKEVPPTPPPHGLELSPTQLQVHEDPSSALQSSKRRSSSPLKHEYAPTVTSRSSSDYDSDSHSDSSSDTSEDFNSENADMPTPLVAVTKGTRRASTIIPLPPPSSIPSTATRTLAPSDSASQGPYRTVPCSTNVAENRKFRKIALVCSWSDKGHWDQIHPDECSIVISPGLIEAFEMSAAHSGTQSSNDNGQVSTSTLMKQPLVAFELTPIVPLRRGTALDITIRSPPTSHSKIRTANNIMFRSRNADECQALYEMINWARCNNPTYIELERARPRQPPVTFNTGQAQHSRSRSGSWFNFGGNDKKSSYRASSAPNPHPGSIGGVSEASVGSMASAISALKRFGANSAFSLNRSSVIRKNRSQTSGSLYSASSGTQTGSGSGSSTPAPSQLGFIPGKDGPNVPSTSAAAVDGGGMVNNMKIRLYIRKGQHWENLGAGRLSVLPAVTTTPEENTPTQTPNIKSQDDTTPKRQTSVVTVGQPGQNRGPRLPSSTHTPHRIHGNGREKRIIVTKNKDSKSILLDVVLGESCFERVMQTGIAVKVWSEDDEIGNTGGVILGREQVYMMQFSGTKEAGWVFGLCGTYRYATE